MLKIAITGGIGMGKSAVEKWLTGHSLPVIDTDNLARQVVELGRIGLVQLVAHFGKQVLNHDGTLDRSNLAEIIFHNSSEKRVLESILHPLILEECDQWIRKQELLGKNYCFVSIPLLFEISIQKRFDRIICIATTPAIQRERLLKRGMSEDQITLRIASQLPISEKIKLSDYIIFNNGTLEDLEIQLVKLLENIKL